MSDRDFQSFLQYFKRTLIVKCTMLINSEFKEFNETYIKFVNNKLEDSSDSDNNDDKRQDLSSTSDSEQNDNSILEQD